jgi:segregation and condensation protein B
MENTMTEEQSQQPDIEEPEQVLDGEQTDAEQPDIEEQEQTLDEEQTDLPQPDAEVKLTTESVVEAVLFASDEPLSVARLADIVETGVKQIRKHIENLNEKYEVNKNAFRVEQIAGGYQMLTLSPYNDWLKKLLRARSDGKLSPAALETLAIIAYKQPVIRVDIEAIRGVAAGEMIRGLMYKGLVKIVGRAEVLGRPMLYGTTKKFLEIFGLNSLKDLPKIEELKKPEA